MSQCSDLLQTDQCAIQAPHPRSLPPTQGDPGHLSPGGESWSPQSRRVVLVTSVPLTLLLNKADGWFEADLFVLRPDDSDIQT